MTNTNNKQEDSSITRGEKDMADKFQEDLDNFLVNFIETWKDVVDVHAVVMTSILVMQRKSLSTASVIVEDCASQGYDLLAVILKDFKERVEEIRTEHNIDKLLVGSKSQTPPTKH